MRARLAASWRRWLDDRRGVAAIEFALIGPVLIILLLGCVTLFLAYRDSQDAEKATFTIADLLSRRTDPVDNAFLDTTQQLFLKMVSRSTERTKYRISSLTRVGGKFSVDWSYAVAPRTALRTADIPAASLPLVADGDSLILVETAVSYDPLFEGLGMTSGEHVNLAANRPRFIAAIAKSD
ncbi:MAG: TadE/TadG family type IV pilus assembly protein [Methylobacterium sp.]